MSLRTVSGEDLLDEMWKKIKSSPAMMYDTPYPSSATGPKPPPADMQSGFFVKSSLEVWPCGVCDVDRRHGSLNTSYADHTSAI